MRAIPSILLATALLGAPALGQSKAGTDSWTQYRGDALNHGVSHSKAPELKEVAWKYFLGGPATSTPVVANGTVYIASELGHVHAIALKDGSKVWSKLLADQPGPGMGSVFTTPLVLGDHVFVATKAGHVHALKVADGSESWKFGDGSGRIYGSIKSDGKRLFFPEVRGKNYDRAVVRCLEPKTGKLIWSRSLFRESGSTPAVLGESLFIAGRDKILWEIATEDGSVRRRIDLDGTTHATPTVAMGYVFLVTGNRRAAAYDLLSGQVVWETNATSDVTISVGFRDGVAYLPLGAHFQAHNAVTGEKLWEFIAKHKVAPPCLLDSGEIYISARDGFVRRLDPKTGEAVQEYDLGQKMVSGPVVCGGRLLVATTDNFLFCFR